MGGATARSYSASVPGRRRGGAHGQTQTKAATARNRCASARVATAVYCGYSRRRSYSVALAWLCRLFEPIAPHTGVPSVFRAESAARRTSASAVVVVHTTQSNPARGIMVVHHSATSVTMEVDPPRNANSPDDPKTANGSSENEKAEDSESSDDGPPLDVGEHYLVRRYDDSWRKYTHPGPPGRPRIEHPRESASFSCPPRACAPVRADPAGARNVISVRAGARARCAGRLRVRGAVCLPSRARDTDEMLCNPPPTGAQHV